MTPPSSAWSHSFALRSPHRMSSLCTMTLSLGLSACGSLRMVSGRMRSLMITSHVATTAWPVAGALPAARCGSLCSRRQMRRFTGLTRQCSGALSWRRSRTSLVGLCGSWTDARLLRPRSSCGFSGRGSSLAASIWPLAGASGVARSTRAGSSPATHTQSWRRSSPQAMPDQAAGWRTRGSAAATAAWALTVPRAPAVTAATLLKARLTSTWTQLISWSTSPR
mmetsp:Transcript_42289/g.134338  ORF Transcript_42289/g.134338 Transcript_42289/m.134338 type:complete len:223 (+) Transcript_42289:886-1554(+)